MTTLIRIPITEKEFYKYNMARFFATNLPDRYRFMREIIWMLQKYDEINTKVKEKLGDKYDEIMSQIEYYQVLDTKAELIRSQLADAIKNGYYEKANKILHKELLQIATKLAPIQKPIIQVWHLMVKETDLSEQNIPREEILHPDKMPFKGTPIHDNRLSNIIGTG